MSDGENKLTVLEQMNQLLAEKEKNYREKEEKLEERAQKLKEFEKQLLAKGEELKAQMLQIEAEKRELERRNQELQTYAENLEEAMSQVMKDKLEIESSEKKTQELEWEDDKLNDLTAALGLNQDVAETQKAPDMYKKMQKLIKRRYSTWSILEATQEHLCIEAGDKEIRIFEGQPISEVHVIWFVKNAKNNKQLNAKIVGISRVAPEWAIRAEENQVVCIFQFSKSLSEENVLNKVNDFISTHL